MNKILLILLFFFTLGHCLNAQDIAVLKYGGGGDWYANPTSVPNLIRFCNRELGTSINEKPQTVEAGSMDIFQYPFLHMTGHGNVFFSEEEAKNLRTYLLSGGFLHIDDNYGMKPYLEKELPKIFPDKEWTELPANHPIFQQKFRFPDGLPKIHEHDNKPPQAYGYFHKGRLVLLYTYETDLGDGWEDPEVHHDPGEVRRKALQMGANIVQFVFEN
ncbi:DUF4159 domain-containing protein [Sinomicrobium kalidii]|uniref:DUF4159 domain-containing protein n=1 Tax=Sinomicrobium kalidii TaxID=2900738 RepID=UPI001E4B0A5A|nr:DUF4159 domain-containing protein [Sinomicrobium kalidii]UGU16926.1 DUF4159 domain-containing protein [Sinomicrobium kalidii]